jgi:hypothetical protein
LFGAVAAVYRERFLPYVPRVVANIIRRFKDPEGRCVAPHHHAKSIERC